MGSDAPVLSRRCRQRSSAFSARAENVESRYFYPPEGEPPLNGTYGCLVITADKGLAGAYNQNVLKEAQQHAAIAIRTPSCLWWANTGGSIFMRHNIPIERSFLYTAQNPTMQRAREITAVLLERFESGELQKIFVIYTDIKNSLAENVHLHAHAALPPLGVHRARG